MFIKAMSYIQTDNILELGCGVGQFANLLHDNRDVKYVGIDFSDVAIRRCNALSLDDYKFYLDDIYTTRFINEFDSIISLETLEHVDDMKVLNRVDAGKKLIISLPTFNNEAHLIWFENEQQIIDRYKGIIEIQHIHRISDWFLFSGTKI